MASLKTDLADEQYSGQRPDKRYHGKFLGYVRDTADPEERGRVRFHCPEVMGDKDDPDTWLDWALPCFPLAGGFDAGSMLVPPAPRDVPQGPPGSPLREWICWIEFRHGDPRFPIYTGGAYITDDDLPRFSPKTTSGKTVSLDASQRSPHGAQRIRRKKIAVDGTIEPGTTAREKPPAADPTYPHNRLIKTPKGHLFELDDSPGDERIRLFHAVGSYLEIDALGTLVSKIVGKAFTYVSENLVKNVVGSSLEIHGGEASLQYRADLEQIVDGLRRIVVVGLEEHFSQSSYTHAVSGKYSLAAANMAFESLEGFSAIVAGDVSIGAGGQATFLGIDTELRGAKSLEISCPHGIVIHSAAPAAAAVSYLYDSFELEAKLARALAILVTDLTPATAEAPITVKALSTFAASLVKAFSGSHTSHRVG